MVINISKQIISYQFKYFCSFPIFSSISMMQKVGKKITSGFKHSQLFQDFKFPGVSYVQWVCWDLNFIGKCLIKYDIYLIIIIIFTDFPRMRHGLQMTGFNTYIGLTVETLPSLLHTMLSLCGTAGQERKRKRYSAKWTAYCILEKIWSYSLHGNKVNYFIKLLYRIVLLKLQVWVIIWRCYKSTLLLMGSM